MHINGYWCLVEVRNKKKSAKTKNGIANYRVNVVFILRN